MLEQYGELVKLLFMCSVIRTKDMSDYFFVCPEGSKSTGLQRCQNTLEQQPFQALPCVMWVVQPCGTKMAPIFLVSRALWIF